MPTDNPLNDDPIELSDHGPVSGRPVMLATQLVKAIETGSTDADVIAANEDHRVLLEGLTGLALLLLKHHANQTGETPVAVLDGLQRTGLAAISEGAVTG